MEVSPVQQIAECRKGFQVYFNRIDTLQQIVDRINNDLTKMEQNMVKAEEELGTSDNSIRSFLKPFIGKVVKTSKPRNETTVQQTFMPTEVFKATDFFPESSKPKT